MNTIRFLVFLIFITLPLIPSRFMKNTVQQRLLREEVVM